MADVLAPSPSLPPWRRVLVVVAHPDDESFGLGAVIDRFIDGGAEVEVLCFTQGEASTLGAAPDLAATRADELTRAAHALGARAAHLRHHPDGGLAALPPDQLDVDVTRSVHDLDADGFLVFDTTGITGHPDHTAASESALRVAARLDLPVLAWTLSQPVALRLREETGAPFLGRDPDDIDLVVTVDRARQHEAITCHASQALPTSVLWRRLELLGDQEYLHWLRRPTPPGTSAG